MFGVFVERLFWPFERDDYFAICHDVVQDVFTNDLKGFSFYWYTGIQFKPYQPKISGYKKVWKTIEEDFNMEGFILGPETEVLLNEEKYFAGIAKLDETSFSNPKQFESMLRSGVMFASSRPDLLSQEFLRELFLCAHVTKDVFYRFNYMGIIEKLCLQGDFVFVYEDNCESRSVSLAFKQGKVDIFRKYVKQYR
jgi:hypothetical protein